MDSETKAGLSRRDFLVGAGAAAALTLYEVVTGSDLHKTTSKAPQPVPTPTEPYWDRIVAARPGLERTVQFANNPGFKEFVDQLYAGNGIEVNAGIDTSTEIVVPYEGQVKATIRLGVPDSEERWQFFTPAGVAAQAAHVESVWEDLRQIRSGVQSLPETESWKESAFNYATNGYYFDEVGWVKALYQEYDVFNQAQGGNPPGKTDVYYQPDREVFVNLTHTQSNVRRSGLNWNSRDWIEACTMAYGNLDKAESIFQRTGYYLNFLRWLPGYSENLA